LAIRRYDVARVLGLARAVLAKRYTDHMAAGHEDVFDGGPQLYRATARFNDRNERVREAGRAACRIVCAGIV
jgi:hypothetical protein